VQCIENSAEGSKMFFPFKSTPRKHWQPRGSRRAHAVTRTARAVCEAVSGGRYPCVRKNRARARARTCSPRLVEDQAHTDVWSHQLSLVCIDHRVATMHFLATAIFRHRSRTRRRSVYLYDNTHSSE